MTVNNSHLKSYSVAQELVKNSRWPKLFSSSVFCNLIIHKVQTMNNERWARRGQKQLSMCLTLANESMTIDYTFYKLTSVSHQVSGSVSSSLTHARPVMIHGDSLLVVFKVRHPDILDFVVLVCWYSVSTREPAWVSSLIALPCPAVIRLHYRHLNHHLRHSSHCPRHRLRWVYMCNKYGSSGAIIALSFIIYATTMSFFIFVWFIIFFTDENIIHRYYHHPHRTVSFRL